MASGSFTGLTFTGSWKDAAWAKIFSFSARQNLGHS
jgi:hypothetical protein